MSLPPAQPAYILRGHGSQIHATAFIRSNARLLTGDAEGWIVSWSLATKRPVAVWRAHEGTILGARGWGPNKVITHGKDNKLIVWKLSQEDESSMSTVLPVDTPPEPRKQPWLLHVLHVNTMNFCSFAMSEMPSPSAGQEDELLIAVPNTMSSETVDIFHLPTSTRIHTVPTPPSLKGGLIMALSLFPHPASQTLTLLTGYESGHTTTSALTPPSTWTTLYQTQAHTQPILSLSPSPSKSFYLTTSADATIAKHPIPSPPPKTTASPLLIIKTGHAGQQSVQIRSDARVFATAGWDGRVRVYGCGRMRELAVLKWHSEGCFAVGFADVGEEVSRDVNEGASREPKDESVLAEKPNKNGMSLIEQREMKEEGRHWLAAGSKDGKVSLWDIY